MYLFLLSLLTGFILAGSHAFTATYSRCWGDRDGRLATSPLRNMLGIPLYMIGLVLAWQAAALRLFAPGTVSQGLAWLFLAVGAVR